MARSVEQKFHSAVEGRDVVVRLGTFKRLSPQARINNIFLVTQLTEHANRIARSLPQGRQGEGYVGQHASNVSSDIKVPARLPRHRRGQV